MRREVSTLTKIERREKRQKLRGESVCRIIEMNVEKVSQKQKMSRNNEKSGTEVGNCVKGLRIRKAVPPPEDEFLLKLLRGVLSSE